MISVWFTSNPIGFNTLSDTVKTLCKDAEIKGYHTNHSLRATTATRGLDKGIPDKFVMERTGHRDIKSLQSYQRPSIEQKIEISKAFESTVSLKRELKPEKEEKQEETELHGGIKKFKSSSTDSLGRSVHVFENCTFNVTKDLHIA